MDSVLERNGLFRTPQAFPQLNQTDVLVFFALSGTLDSNIQLMMVTVEEMVLTALPAESFEMTRYHPCGKRANGRDGLEQSIVASGLVNKSQDMMATVVRIMVHHVLHVMMSLCRYLSIQYKRAVLCFQIFICC